MIMASNSKIQWTDHTLNFWVGCQKVSEGCKYCYFYRDSEKFGQDPREVREVSEKTITKVLKSAKKGDKIFVCSWSDFFLPDADGFRDKAWDIIRSHPELTFQILTKRPERILDNLPEDWGNGWDNVWLGISVENQVRFHERMGYFGAVPAKVRFLSIEPILGPIQLDPWLDLTQEFRTMRPGSAIDWVIIGGESGNELGNFLYRESEVIWFTAIVQHCLVNNVPVFVKQLGTHLYHIFQMSDRHGSNIDEFPDGLKVRQFPVPIVIEDNYYNTSTDLENNAT